MALSRRALLRTGLTVSAVGAAGVVSSTTVAAAAEHGPAAAAAPTIHGTSAWGARAANGTIEVLNHKPTYIVVHHTADPNTSDLSLAHAYANSRAIQNYHMDSNGWIDTGQQLTNSRGGHITEGRHKSVQALTSGTTHVMGANVADHNSEVIGIENEGLYTSVDVTPQLWASLVDLVSYIASKYGIAPAQIKGHRDFNSTQCPGDVLYARLPELRSAVGARLGVAVVEPPTWPLLKPGDTGTKVLAAQHLLRDRGADVAADGVFGPAMATAVQNFAAAEKLTYEPCYASRVGDESMLLGATAWPRLVRTVRASEESDAGVAARVLLDAQGQRGSYDQTVDARKWQSLLS